MFYPDDLHGASYFDLRDLLDSIEEAEKGEDSEFGTEEIVDLMTIKADIEGQLYGSLEDAANNEPSLIAEWYFEDYARELAEDIGAIDRDASWPAYHIDWEAAANDLKQDYTEIEILGQTFYMRSY